MALCGLFLTIENMYNLEPLFERAESYAKINFELYKLKLINKSVAIISTFVSRGIVILLLSIFIVSLNIGVALWLGDLLGKSYYGFFCVAGFYGIIAAIVYFFMHKSIKKRIGNSIISQLMN